MTQVETHMLTTRTHGSYLLELPVGDVRTLLVGFHGYGETAHEQLPRLRQLPGADQAARVSVQSLHLFYTKLGAVVGSWMTRHLREQAIADNVAYVAGVLAELRLRFPRAALVYVGFSQGAAMAYRAAAGAGQSAAALISVGGDVPPDVAAQSGTPLPPTLVLRGADDPWYTTEKFEADRAALTRLGVDLCALEYPQAHEWPTELPAAAVSFLHARLG